MIAFKERIIKLEEDQKVKNVGQANINTEKHLKRQMRDANNQKRFPPHKIEGNNGKYKGKCAFKKNGIRSADCSIQFENKIVQRVKVGNLNNNTKIAAEGNKSSLTKNQGIQKQAAYHPVGQSLRDKIQKQSIDSKSVCPTEQAAAKKQNPQQQKNQP